jgi:hypothetical protein
MPVAVNFIGKLLWIGQAALDWTSCSNCKPATKKLLAEFGKWIFFAVASKQEEIQRAFLRRKTQHQQNHSDQRGCFRQPLPVIFPRQTEIPFQSFNKNCRRTRNAV